MQSNPIKLPKPKLDLIPNFKKQKNKKTKTNKKNKKQKTETIPVEGMGLMMAEAWTIA